MRSSPPDTPDFEPSSNPTARYHPHIDGLRAVSILAVVGYHTFLPGFSGGFVGVDVFFVISGYLILGQIGSGLADGRFRLGSFYARRFLRILPALLLMLAATALVARFALITPDDLREFRHEVVSASLMFANLHFLRTEGDYFGRAIEVKPLLHTWSLMVEEQFYLVAPLAALAVLRTWRRSRRGFRSAVIPVAAGFIAASLASSVLLTDPEYNAAFFLTPFRAWEFAVGGLIPLALPGFARLPAWTRSCVAPLGLVAILAATVCFDSTTPYPALYVVLPVAGAALVIAPGLAEPSDRTTRLLSGRAIVWLGLLSYGWYLWHWPLLVFGRLLWPESPALLRDLAAVAIGLGIAFVTFRLVDRPVRRHRDALMGRPLAVVASAAAMLAAFAVVSQREFTQLRAVAVEERARLIAAQTSPAFQECPQDPDGESCTPAFQNDGSTILIGDSHAESIVPALARAADMANVNLVQSLRMGCLALEDVEVFYNGKPRARCRGFWEETLQQIARTSPPVTSAIVVQNWNMYLGAPDVAGRGRTSEIGPPGDGPSEDPLAFLRERLSASLTALEAAGVERILLVGQFPDFGYDPVNCIMRVQRFSADAARCRRRTSSQDLHASALRKTLEAAVSGHPGRRWRDPSSSFCTEEFCSALGRDGRLLFVDRSHVSGAGAELFYRDSRSDLDWSLGAP
jgi:peptidoglycan/LPS O-acetylase OafA/YrhL